MKSTTPLGTTLKTKPKEQLENAATKAKDELAKAQKVLDEYKNKDLSDERRQLNDKLARLDELNLYVGRVDKNSPNDATIARLEARYGEDYADIVREKIDKENADEVLDISFAPKRSDESALSEKLGNFDIMSRENLNKDKNMAKNDLTAKTTSELSKEELDALPLVSNDEFSDFLDKIAKKDYANTPLILKIALLNDTLKAIINKNQNANVFITRARAGHISERRKGRYFQALRMDEQRQIPSILQNAKEAYTGGGSGFVLPFKDSQNASKINLIVLNSDNKGNFLITAKKIDKVEFEKAEYQKASKGGS